MIESKLNELIDIKSNLFVFHILKLHTIAKVLYTKMANKTLLNIYKNDKKLEI